MRHRLVSIVMAMALVLVACSEASGSGSDVAPGDGASASPTAAPSPTLPTTTLPPATQLPATTTLPPTTLPPATLAPATTTLAPATTTLPPTTTTARPPPQPRTERIALQVDGRQREYVLFVPDGLGAGPYPLVVDFHGFTVDADRHDRLSKMRAKAADEGFIVAQPDGALIGNGWDSLAGSSDVGFVRTLVEDVSSRVHVDRDRVYGSGFSNGGGLVNRIACEASDLFAAMGTVSGAYLGAAQCPASRPVPVQAIHGDEDLVVPYGGGLGLLPAIELWAEAWAERNSCASQPASEQVAEDVVLLMWDDCAQDAVVELYKVQGGGHDWPGPGSKGGILSTTESISATDLFWEFFVAHPMR